MTAIPHQDVRDLSEDEGSKRSVASTLIYWLLAAGITGYVAMCTGNRDAIPEADAWEHHRVLVALTDTLWKPGNPTFALDNPSIRYSPYFLVQALLCRTFHLDPYTMLSGAAVVNTALLFVGLWSLFCAWGERRAAALAVLTIVGLWGIAPGYAGTTALSDLPWHQVNPSAFSFATFFLALASLKRFIERGGGWRWIGITLVCTVAMLDHAMTGAFMLMALFIAAAMHPQRRLTTLGGMFACGAIALGVCLAWPWYPFLDALLSRKDVDYWFNGAISTMMLTQWCAPAIVLALAALLKFDRPLVRLCLAIGAAGLFLSAVSIPLRSPTFARFAMPASVMLQIAITVWAVRSGALCIQRWREGATRLMRSPASRENAPFILLLFFVIALLYGLLPQAADVLKKPHLARPLIAKFAKIRTLEPRLKPIYDELLQDIGPRDVVLATPMTSWPIPSSRGRIVAALHYERFVDDQPNRMADAEAFFDESTTEQTRSDILNRYDVRWILIDTNREPRATQQALLGRYPQAKRVENFILLSVRS